MVMRATSCREVQRGQTRQEFDLPGLLSAIEIGLARAHDETWYQR